MKRAYDDGTITAWYYAHVMDRLMDKDEWPRWFRRGVALMTPISFPLWIVTCLVAVMIFMGVLLVHYALAWAEDMWA